MRYERSEHEWTTGGFFIRRQTAYCAGLPLTFKDLELKR